MRAMADEESFFVSADETEEVDAAPRSRRVFGHPPDAERRADEPPGASSSWSRPSRGRVVEADAFVDAANSSFEDVHEATAALGSARRPPRSDPPGDPARAPAQDRSAGDASYVDSDDFLSGTTPRRPRAPPAPRPPAASSSPAATPTRTPPTSASGSANPSPTRRATDAMTPRARRPTPTRAERSEKTRP